LSVGFSHECLPNKKYIGSYAAVLNGLNAIIFTAGIGENSYIRKLVCMIWNILELNWMHQK
jgi:acetate kinase